MSVTSSCGNLLVTRTSRSGIIFSNRNGRYGNGMRCQWFLSSNAKLDLRFFRFSTESCCDRVYVYDGGSSSSPVIGSFSGSSLPSTITNSSNRLFVRFVTDGSVTGTGFAASYHGKKFSKALTHTCKGIHFVRDKLQACE